VEFHQDSDHERLPDRAAVDHRAYAFARMQFRFKSQTLSALMLLQMFPAVLALVAIYAIFETMGSYVPWLGIDHHGSLVLAYTGGIAMHIWTIKGYLPDHSRSRSRKRPRSTAPRTGRPSATCCCPWPCPS
jgi:hypothetical protein